MEQVDHIDSNGIRITAEDIRAHYRAYGRQTEFRSPVLTPVPEEQLEELVQATLDKLKKGPASPTLPFIEPVNTVASLTNPSCKPWLGAVFSTDPEQKKKTDDLIRSLMKINPPEELQVVSQHKAIYDELVIIYKKLQENDMGCYAAITLIVQWSRNCGFELHEPYTLRSFGSSLMRGNRPINKWQDVVNCALNFMVNNHKAMGNDLGKFIEEICAVSNYLTAHSNNKGRIDQVEPNVFRVMTTGDNPTLLFMWKQHADGYTIKRNQK